MRRFSPIPIALLLAACYRYEPHSTPLPVAGENVRMHFTLSGSQDVARVLGSDIASFDGRMVSEAAGILLFAVSSTVTRGGKSATWTGEQVHIPRTAIEKLELRVLDKKRTIRTTVFIVLGAVGISALIQKLARDAVGSPPVGGGGPPPT